MALLEIKRCPDPVLRKRAEEVIHIDREILTLIDDMFETMYTETGIGLAANQVGILKRVIVVDVERNTSRTRGRNPIVLINPTILSSEGEIIEEEGCLSLPEISANVPREKKIEVCGLDKGGNKIIIKAEGILARAFQHEIDHINGFLFWDRLNRVKREILKRKYRRLRKGDNR